MSVALDPVDPQPEPARCTATSRQSGERCKRAPTPGASVCYYHGGAAPQVRKAAARKLATQRAAAKLADWDYEPVDDPMGAMADYAGQARALVAVLASELADGKPTAATVEALGAALERAHRMAKDLASTGFEKRRLELSEDLHDWLAAFIAALVRKAGLDPDETQVQGWIDATLTELPPNRESG